MARTANKPKISWSLASGSNYGLKPNDPIWNDEKKLKARIAAAIVATTWSPNDADWRYIEKAYQHPIPEALRKRIVEATNKLKKDIQLEKNSISFEQVSTYLEGIERAALAFYGAFNAAGGLVRIEGLRCLASQLEPSKPDDHEGDDWGKEAIRAARKDLPAFAGDVRACIDAIAKEAIKQRKSPGPFDHNQSFKKFIATIVRTFATEEARAKKAGKSERFPTTINTANKDSVSDFPRCVEAILAKAEIKIFKVQTAYSLSNHMKKARAEARKRAINRK